MFIISWQQPQQSAGTDSFPSHALSLPEEVPNPDALYSSLDMLTEDLQTEGQNDCHSANRGKGCFDQLFHGPAVCVVAVRSNYELSCRVLCAQALTWCTIFCTGSLQPFNWLISVLCLKGNLHPYNNY